MNKRYDLSDKLVLAVLCTLLLSGVSALASLHTLLHEDYPVGRCMQFSRWGIYAFDREQGWS